MPEPYVAVVQEPIDPAPLVRLVQSDACGAVVTFAGVVRERSDDDRPVSGLTYEAYPAMALAEMRAIAGEARTRFGEVGLALVHRTGALQVGETSVLVVAAAPHRGPAFDACEFAIDALKVRVEVWKKEHYLDGDATWRENQPASGARSAAWS